MNNEDNLKNEEDLLNKGVIKYEDSFKKKLFARKTIFTFLEYL